MLCFSLNLGAPNFYASRARPDLLYWACTAAGSPSRVFHVTSTAVGAEVFRGGREGTPEQKGQFITIPVVLEVLLSQARSQKWLLAYQLNQSVVIKTGGVLRKMSVVSWLRECVSLC